MSIWTRVPGVAGECRVSARALHRLARRLDAAGADTAIASHLSDDDFGGRAGTAFRTRTRDLSVLVDVQVGRCRSLATGLEDLADGLEEAESLMARVRSEARHGLELDGWTLRRRAPVVPEQATAWARATVFAARARQIEADAQSRWQERLARISGVRETLGVPSDGPMPPDSQPSSPLGLAPVTSGPAAGPAG